MNRKVYFVLDFIFFILTSLLFAFERKSVLEIAIQRRENLLIKSIESESLSENLNNILPLQLQRSYFTNVCFKRGRYKWFITLHRIQYVARYGDSNGSVKYQLRWVAIHVARIHFSSEKETKFVAKLFDLAMNRNKYWIGVKWFNFFESFCFIYLRSLSRSCERFCRTWNGSFLNNKI